MAKFDSIISCKLPHSKPFVKTKVTNVGVELCQCISLAFCIEHVLYSAQLLFPFYFVSLGFFERTSQKSRTLTIRSSVCLFVQEMQTYEKIVETKFNWVSCAEDNPSCDLCVVLRIKQPLHNAQRRHRHRNKKVGKTVFFSPFPFVFLQCTLCDVVYTLFDFARSARAFVHRPDNVVKWSSLSWLCGGRKHTTINSDCSF